MGFYRKNPVVIEAVQLRWDNWDEMCAFVNVPENGVGIEEDMPQIAMAIYTLEGPIKASENDWIIKGIAGEFYPCKPDIFEKTFELEDV